jgi:hypothetical protein
VNILAKERGGNREVEKIYGEELSDLYCSENIFRLIKSRRMRWEGHVEIYGRGKVQAGFWWGILM